jgi:hypothetical protein
MILRHEIRFGVVTVFMIANVEHRCFDGQGAADTLHIQAVVAESGSDR